MQKTITWLHLSDLHANPTRTGWDARRVTETLCDDLKRLREEQGLRPDLIFFTGDAAFGQIGHKKGERIQDQFAAAHKFLTDVRRVYEPELTLRDVYLVPGNHDVNRDEVDPTQAFWLGDKSRKLDEIVSMIHGRTKLWQRFLERLEEYRSFLEERGYHHLLTDEEGRLIFADSREIGGLRVGVLGFNSAWSCCQDGEKGRLWVGGRYQLEELQGRLGKVDFQIGLIHHPGSWFVEAEDPEVWRLLRRDLQFVLHGHEHQDWVNCDSSGHATISAGACYECSDHENGYSIVRLDRAKGTGEVWLRRFDPRGGGWVAREVSGRTKNGCWPLDLRGKPWFDRLLLSDSGEEATGAEPASRAVVAEASGSERAAEYERRFRRAMVNKHDYLELFGADLTREGSKQYALSVAYVSLNLSEDEEIDDDEAEVETEDLDSGESFEPGVAPGFRGSLPVEEVFHRLAPGNSRLLIRGAAGCGKSTLLRWATIEAAKQELGGAEGVASWRTKVPFLIRLRDCAEGKLPRPKDFPALLAKELPDPTPNWIDEVLARGGGLVMLDGVDEVPTKYRTRVQKEIAAIIDAYPECFYIVSTRPAAVERRWLTRLDFFEARVEPMSAADREVFIDRWHDAVADQLRSRRLPRENLEELAIVLKRKLQDSPQIARLAIYPLLCAMICALHRERNQELPETQARLCEDLCLMLLDRRERESPGLSMDHLPDAYRRLDYEKKKYIVAELARFMLVDLGGASSMPEDDVEKRIEEALSRFPDQQGSDPVEVRQGLIERSGLLRPAESGRIDFLHNTLKEYLAAERLVSERAFSLLTKNAEDAAWQPVILFAVALPDSDFASELLKKLLQKWRPKTERKKGRLTNEEKKAETKERARQFFLLRLRNAAFRLEPDLVERVDTIARAVLPPRTIADAEMLAECGESVVPFLRAQKNWNARKCIASLRALRLIGGPAAARCVQTYFVGEDRNSVLRELLVTASTFRLKTPLNSELASLDLSGLGIDHLPPLARCPSLRALNLSNTRVSDLSPLAGCSSLQSLSLDTTLVSDLSPLAGCTSLATLNLSYASVSDLSPLAGCPSLGTLNLSYTMVSDLSPLTGCTVLSLLNLSGTRVSDLSPLADCKSLDSLYLRETWVSDLSPLASCPSLRVLNLYTTQVSDLSPLADCASLEILCLCSSQVNRLSSLVGCTSLRIISCDSWAIDDLSSLPASLRSKIRRAPLQGRYARWMD